MKHTCDKENCKNEHCLYKNGAKVESHTYINTKIDQLSDSQAPDHDMSVGKM